MSSSPPTHFIRQQLDADLASGKHNTIVTRFPPEPNGYLHIGHAKSMWLNFGVAADYHGQCRLRFDDTNPAQEEAKFAAAIKTDIRWLGYQWSEITHASDYFETLYDYAGELIDQGLAYIDSLSGAEIRHYRGTLAEPGKNSPYRDRTIAENRDLFTRMRAGEFADGEHVLRAKIDMVSPNINLRDPILYRIRHLPHPRTGDQWCIYPMYDFAHGQGDAIEGVTHSLCTLEFADHRPLYDWFLTHLKVPAPPRQLEFSRLNLDYAVMSKRLLTQLVEARHVDGWDDPRMPTLCGLRRRGYTPAAINNFIATVGITKKDHSISMRALEHSIRQDLDPNAPRTMAVLRPLKVIIENYPADTTETIEVAHHPADPTRGSRAVTLAREIYIEQDDFMDDPPPKFHRLGLGGAVRLRYGFVIVCTEVTRTADGQPHILHCEYIADTRAGKSPVGQKVKGIIHWLAMAQSTTAEIRLYDRLFNVAKPLADKTRALTDGLNPQSLTILRDGKIDPAIATTDLRYQFERLGYFYRDPVVDPAAPSDAIPIFNRIVSLRDSWAKQADDKTAHP